MNSQQSVTELCTTTLANLLLSSEFLVILFPEMIYFDAVIYKHYRVILYEKARGVVRHPENTVRDRYRAWLKYVSRPNFHNFTFIYIVYRIKQMNSNKQI